MICAPCKHAGTALQLEYDEHTVKSLHLQCPAVLKGQPTLCDCQHQLISMASESNRKPLN